MVRFIQPPEGVKSVAVGIKNLVSPVDGKKKQNRMGHGTCQSRESGIRSQESGVRRGEFKSQTVSPFLLAICTQLQFPFRHCHLLRGCHVESTCHCPLQYPLWLWPSFSTRFPSQLPALLLPPPTYPPARLPCRLRAERHKTRRNLFCHFV